MARVYCTYFDHRYLSRGLALIHSLRAHGDQAEVWVLCMSDACFAALTKLDIAGVRPVTLDELEAVMPQLRQARKTRSVVEYYFTCTPHLIRFVFDARADVFNVAYLDADLFYFADPQIAFDEMSNAPVAIIPHNFSPPLRSLENFGLYNVGWVGFARSEEGLRCLDWWCAHCLEWCYDRPEADRFADQKYLERFFEIAPSCKVLRHKGLNAAPWNVGNYRVWQRGDAVMLDDDPLVFFHFHGVKTGWGRYYFNSHRQYRAPYSRLIGQRIYRPYIAALCREDMRVSPLLALPARAGLKRGTASAGFDWLGLRRQAKIALYHLTDLVTGRAVRRS